MKFNLFSINCAGNPPHSRVVRRGWKAASTLLLCVLVSAPETARTDDPDSFEQAIHMAMDSNHSIRVAREILAATKEKYAQSMADLLPEASLNAAKSRRVILKDSLANRDFFDSSEDLTRFDMRVAQPVFRWRAVLALRQVESIITAAESELDTASQDVLLETIQGIVKVLLTEKMATLAENNLAFTRRNLDATVTRRQAGHLTRTDVDQATARVSSAEAEWIRAKNDAMVARARFEEVVRMAVPEELSVPNVPSHLLRGELEELSAQIHNRPDMRAAKARLESAQYAIDIEESGHLPNVDLSANASSYRGGSGGTIQQGSDYTVAIQLSVPLYAGGRTQSKTREATHLKSSKEMEFDRVRDQSLRKVKQAYLEMHSAKAMVKSAEGAFSFYGEALRGIHEEFQAGFRTVIDLLEAQNQLFKSETELVKNHHELLSSQYQLLHTIGLLTLDNLHSSEQNQQVFRGDASRSHTTQAATPVTTQRQQSAAKVKNTRKNLPEYHDAGLPRLTMSRALPTDHSLRPSSPEPSAVQVQTFPPIAWPLRLTKILGMHASRELLEPPHSTMKDNTTGAYFVCVGSFKQAESITQAAAKLAAAGYVPLQERVTVQGERFTRVFYGPFPNNAAALAAKITLLDHVGNFEQANIISRSTQEISQSSPSF